ncbi:hypothetical protein VSH64_16250 [Amycolatopsis rhabdoformis]|uniref:DUF4192 domain-containing protein n=1 Tax=Amycolatopsis rhabdoformis TaxID=1448059 RepID=A0ABZ1IHM4_9PSEU|nr:hypothetical protein [Amycolatopsis rhabdoformis]WSE33639.1 hypothetical protein VSH64_16250 [Amycolatopsis rhabdoformis]
MTGWSAMAGTHDYAVADRASAEALAEALAAYGFARVVARPGPPEGWLVSALDEGPYPADDEGHRTIDAVGKAATVMARAHGGYPYGGGRGEPGMFTQLSEAPVVRTNPGARPPVPVVRIMPAPPPGALALTPDSAAEVDAPVDLSGLDEIEWSRLGHAHGPAGDTPQLIRALAQNDDGWDAVLDELFGDNLLHQGTCYSATAPALPFVGRLLTTGGLPAQRRLDLCLWLVIAADCRPVSLLGDADRAAARGRAPGAAPWTTEVHLAVGEQLPALLARWTAEPEAIRYVLACLAALYPSQGRRIVEDVATMAADHAGRQPGEYLRLAEALLHADDARALRIAGEIFAWDDLGPDWFDAPHLGSAVKAGHVLAEGTLRTASATA